MTASCAVFFDVDGTLAEFGKPVDRNVITAIRQMRINGHKAFVCTGRPLMELDEDILSIGFDGVVSLSGGYVEIDSEVISYTPVPTDLAFDAINTLIQSEVDFLLQDWNSRYTVCAKGVSWYDGEPVFQTLKQLQQHSPGFRIVKITFHERWLSVIEANPLCEKNFTWVKCAPNEYEMALSGVSKGYGVKQVLNHLILTDLKSFAIGDSENDLSMFRVVGTSIAMGNAPDSVKSHTQYITKPVAQNGVGAALRHFGLIK